MVISTAARESFKGLLQTIPGLAVRGGVGAGVGAGVGLMGTIGTGDWGYTAAGAFLGAQQSIRGRGPAGLGLYGAGMAVGGLAGDAEKGAMAGFAFGGGLLLPGKVGKWAAKGYGKGLSQMGGWGKSYGQLLMGRRAQAAATINKMDNPIWAGFAGMSTLGAMSGAGEVAARSSLDIPSRPVKGYFPGGTGYMPAGRGGISHNHLNTAGLSLGIHRNRFRTSRVMQ